VIGRLFAVRVLFALAVAMTSIVMFGASPAHACSCAPASVREYAERSDVVFVGTITTMESGPAGSNVVYGVEVDQVFKGDVSRETGVVTASQGTACGLPDLPEGKPLFFFATGSTSDSLSVNSCDGTGSALVTAQAVTAALGEPREPSTASDRRGSPDLTDDSDEDGADMAPWMVGGGLLVAAAAGGGVLLRRRRSA
jgi:hypothetical protein